MVPAVGVLITVSILLAAGIAVYENPDIRAWIDRSRQKIAIALHSLGDDVDPRSRLPLDDLSMREDVSEVAENRRRLARAEILERGRIMEEKRRRKIATRSGSDSSQSFDSLVDRSGKLIEGETRPNALMADGTSNGNDGSSWATTSAVEHVQGPEEVTRRQNATQTLHDSIDSPLALRQLSPWPDSAEPVSDPFASRYEREMRNEWNLPLLDTGALSSHASESLIDLTPTSESAPDPEVSIPDISQSSQYFSAPASTSPHAPANVNTEPEFYYARPSSPHQPIVHMSSETPSRSQIQVDVSSAPSMAGSMAGSMDYMNPSELDESDDGVLSEIGDGVHTPASAWTEVGSVVSSDAGH